MISLFRKIFILLCFCFFASAGFFKIAHASVVFDNLTNSSLNDKDLYCQTVDIANDFSCVQWEQYFGTSTSTLPFAATGTLSSITLNIFTNFRACSGNDNALVTLVISDSHGVLHSGTGDITRADLLNNGNQFTKVKFSFPGADTINFPSTQIARLFASNGNCPFFAAQTQLDTLVPSNTTDGNFIGPYCYNFICGNSISGSPDTDHDLMMIIETVDIQAISAKNPVLIVPGVLGTEMFEGQTRLWASVLRMANSLNTDSFMDPLSFSSNLQPIDSSVFYGSIIRNPDNLFDYSDSLINDFSNQGYQENKDLFTFPYDWRFGVSDNNVQLLEQTIKQIINSTSATRIDIVAHSTGGLIVKKYIMDHPTNNYISKVIFVGVPNLGAPKALKSLLSGDSFGILGLEDSEMQKISQNLPVVYDLAPSKEYVNKIGDYFEVTDDRTPTSPGPELMDHDQANQFLEDNSLANPLAITNADNLHTSAFDNFDVRANGIDAYSIVGCKTGTFNGVNYVMRPGVNIPNASMDITGDGTVPMASAASIPANSGHIFYAPQADHGKMLSQNDIRQQIVNIITGSSLPVGSEIITQQNLDNNPSQCQLNGHWWQIFSPLAVEIFDQNGNRSGIASDGSIQNEIPGADYEVMGEHKFIFIPTDQGQVYTTNLTGTGSGTFTFVDETIQNGQVIQTVTFSNVPVTPLLTGTVNMGASTTLTLFSDGSGSAGQTIGPGNQAENSSSTPISAPPATVTSGGTQAPGAGGIVLFSTPVIPLPVNQQVNLPLKLPQPQVLGAVVMGMQHGEDELIKYPDDSTVYLITGGIKRPFTSARDFLQGGFNFKDVQLAWPADDLWTLGLPMYSVQSI